MNQYDMSYSKEERILDYLEEVYGLGQTQTRGIDDKPRLKEIVEIIKRIILE